MQRIARPGEGPKATNLLLIRHGRTDYVTEHRIPGWRPGIHLNDEGRAQAAALARRLADVRLAAIYASPLERALETAGPVAEAHGLPIQVRRDLGDLHPGDWTGRTVEELENEELWLIVQAYPSGARLPGGESFLECQARIVAELDAIRNAHLGQTVAVVSHADPIKLAVAYYVGLPLDLFRRLSISPASVTAVAFVSSGPRLVCLNNAEPSVILSEAKDLGAKDHARSAQEQ
ncbi:MAG: MSMEG_4193 family putative phosphomutase [Anaerolineae bacterium]|nr:MSMEG_4193 family putative phosphomutase [Anaerolineae bacterium]